MAPKARILAIDDQLYFRSLIEGLLSEEGYSVRTTGGDVDLLALIESEGPFDLVIIDPVMPDTSGVELVEEMRRRVPEQEVIVLTGLGDVRSVVSAMQHGAADYLLKPIDRESLLQAIASVLENRRLRVDHARLVEENLEFMRRLSLLERALPLLGLRQPIDAGRALMELVATEARARDGVLWLGGAGPGPLDRAAVRGEVRLEEVPGVWEAPAGDVAASLRSGRTVRVETPEPALLVPCVRGSRMLALIRVSAFVGEQLSTGVELACSKLAEIGALVLAATLERSELERSRLGDPRTGLPGRAFLEMVARTEIHKAHRYGRRLSCLCVDLGKGLPETGEETVRGLARGVVGSLRTIDIVASESCRRLWVLLTETDHLGGVVLKRRLAKQVRKALADAGIETEPGVGVASYPLDGEEIEPLMRVAAERADRERESLVHALGIEADPSLARIGAHLLAQARPLPPGFLQEAAELVIGELSCRPRDRGLLFLAPGTFSGAFRSALSALGDLETATDVFLATVDDTAPAGPAVTPLPLLSDLSAETTWMVRFGEAPPYVLVAGPEEPGGACPVYHSEDPVLVEQLAFRLRAEMGFGPSS